MGNLASSRAPLLPPFTQSKWISDLRAVKRSIKRFERGQTEFGWAVTLEGFKALYSNKTPSPHASQSSYPSTSSGNGSGNSGLSHGSFISDSEFAAVFAIWDPGCFGRTDVLQILAGSILVSRGSYDEKVSLLFDLFDMNLDRALTRDEMTIAVRAALTGFTRMRGIEVPPGDELTSLAKLAFKSADRQECTDAKITHTELLLWAHVTPEVLDIVGRFNTTDIDAIRSGGGVGGLSVLHTLQAASVQDALAVGGEGLGGGKITFGTMAASQNLGSMIEGAAERERELLRTKPALPTSRELSASNETKKIAQRRREEMRMMSSSRYGSAAAAAAASSAASGSSYAASTAAGAVTFTATPPTSPAPAHPPSHRQQSSLSSSFANNNNNIPSPPAQPNSGGSLPRWFKKMEDMLLLRRCFIQCEMPGSGTPILTPDDAAAAPTNASSSSPAHSPSASISFSAFPSSSSTGNSASSSPSKDSLPRIFSLGRRKSDVSTLAQLALSSSTVPGTGFVQLSVFGALMKSQVGPSSNPLKWRKLPAFRSADGPIQPGVALSFRDVLRSYYPEHAVTKREIDNIVAAILEREAALAAAAAPPVLQHQSSATRAALRTSSPPSSTTTMAATSVLPPPTPNGAAAAAAPGVASSGKPLPLSVPRSLVLKIQAVFDSCDNDADRSGGEGRCDGRVRLQHILDILAPSHKLREYIDLPKLMLKHRQQQQRRTRKPQYNDDDASDDAEEEEEEEEEKHDIHHLAADVSSDPNRLVTLHELLQFLFGSSMYGPQLAEMRGWTPAVAELTPARLRELLGLVRDYDQAYPSTPPLSSSSLSSPGSSAAATIALDDLRFSMQQLQSQPSGSNSAELSQEQIDGLLLPYEGGKKRLEWLGFVKAYRSLLPGPLAAAASFASVALPAVGHRA